MQNAILSKLGAAGTKLVMKTKANSPTILFAAGVVGFGATVYFTGSGTLKAKEIIEEHNVDNEIIEGMNARDDLDEVYSAKDYRNDKVKLMLRTFGKLSKVYWPAALCASASIAAFTGAHITLTNRLAGVTAAYSILNEAYEKYRQRVIDEYGSDKDEEFRYNLVKHDVKDAEGKKTKTMVVDADASPSMYARFFDESNPNWQSDAAINRMFLSNIQNWMNERLQYQGHLFLNEVYDALGFERTSAGAVVGWVLNVNGGTGDDFIDFGIFDESDISHRMFVNGDERNVLLDFNVNGVVYDLIDNKRSHKYE